MSDQSVDSQNEAVLDPPSPARSSDTVFPYFAQVVGAVSANPQAALPGMILFADSDVTFVLSDPKLSMKAELRYKDKTYGPVCYLPHIHKQAFLFETNIVKLTLEDLFPHLHFQAPDTPEPSADLVTQTTTLANYINSCPELSSISTEIKDKVTCFRLSEDLKYAGKTDHVNKKIQAAINPGDFKLMLNHNLASRRSPASFQASGAVSEFLTAPPLDLSSSAGAKASMGEEFFSVAPLFNQKCPQLKFQTDTTARSQAMRSADCFNSAVVLETVLSDLRTSLTAQRQETLHPVLDAAFAALHLLKAKLATEGQMALERAMQARFELRQAAFKNNLTFFYDKLLRADLFSASIAPPDDIAFAANSYFKMPPDHRERHPATKRSSSSYSRQPSSKKQNREKPSSKNSTRDYKGHKSQKDHKRPSKTSSKQSWDEKTFHKRGGKPRNSGGSSKPKSSDTTSKPTHSPSK